MMLCELMKWEVGDPGIDDSFYVATVKGSLAWSDNNKNRSMLHFPQKAVTDIFKYFAYFYNFLKLYHRAVFQNLCEKNRITFQL